MARALRASARIEHRPAERQRVLDQVEQASYGRDHLLLPIERVSPNPRNPRQVFSEEAINALAASITEWGQLQPVLVRRVGEHFELIAGERRWRAVQRANLATIWAVERDASDIDSFKLALVENLHREELSRAETVAALDQLAELSVATGLNRTARELRVSPTWLSLRLSVRKDPVVYPALETGRLSFSQAIELRRAPAHARRSLLDRALRDEVGHRVIREWVDQVRTLERQSRAGIGASVALARGSKRKGHDTERSAFMDVLDLLRALGAPQTDGDRAVLDQIAALLETLRASPVRMNRRTAPRATRARLVAIPPDTKGV